ncbi:MAG: MerR family transcriptional regulator [Gemmatimonadota bacterium]
MASHEPPISEIPRHPVRVVAHRTGLSPHVLRAWERRYGLIAPTRTEAGQRLYSDADIVRLTVLKNLAAGGAQISQLARLPMAELERMAQTAGRATPEAQGEPRHPEEWRADAMRAVDAMDIAGLRHGLERGAVSLGVSRLVEEVVSPVLVAIGERWHAGRLTIAQEHQASGAVRQVLGWLRELAETREAAPGLVVGTPPGQIHEGGALMAAAIAASEGWQVTYLGADLPVTEFAETARRTTARAVALSIIHPGNDSEMGGHLRSLGRSLPAGVALLVGGAAAAAYAEAIASAKGKLLSDLSGLRGALRDLTLQAVAPE